MAVRSRWFAGVVALAASACGDADPDVNIDFGDADSVFAGGEATLAEGDEFATLTENGAVKLGLTRERVYFEVSEAVRETVDAELKDEMESSDSRIARSISGAVRRGVASALEWDIDFRVEDIRDVEYEGGELVFHFEDENREFPDMNVDDEPITRAFAEEDARAFVAAFRRVKSGESVRGDDSAAKPAPAPGPKVDTDTSGGASF